MNLTVLKNEINNDPESLGYAGKTAEQQTGLINAVTQGGLVPIWEMEKYLIEQGKLPGINAARLDTAHAAYDAAYTLMHYISSGRFENIDVTLAVVGQMATALISAGLITTANKDAIIALADNRQSRATALGLPKIKAGHITEALAS